jgi:signal peptidase I
MCPQVHQLELHACAPSEATASACVAESQTTQQEDPAQENGNSQSDSNDGYFRVFGLKISKDDLITITLAVAISYGIRW